METAKRPNYLAVFIILALFTFIETLVSYVQLTTIKVPTLVILSTVKALLVLLYFMHLRSDSKVFLYLFIPGLFLVLPLILIISVVLPLIV
jgi:cytochrome c oxidase subunit IV